MHILLVLFLWRTLSNVDPFVSFQKEYLLNVFYVPNYGPSSQKIVHEHKFYKGFSGNHQSLKHIMDPLPQIKSPWAPG